MANPVFGSPEWRAKYAKHQPKPVGKKAKHNQKHQRLLEKLALQKVGKAKQ